MKTNFNLIAAALVLAAAVSCTKEAGITETGSYTKVYTTSVDTKTAIAFEGNTGKVTWSEGDRLMFQFDGADHAGKNVTTSTTGTTGTFAVSVPDDAANVYAARMGDPSLKLLGWWASSAGHIDININDVWTAEGLSFDNVNAIAGKSAVTDNSIRLKPILCLLEFSSTSAVDHYVLTPKAGTEVASRYQYNYSTDETTKKSGATVYESITLNTAGGAGPFFFPVVPGDYNGFKVEGFDNGGSSLGTATIPSFKAEAGAIHNYGDLSSHLGTESGDPAAEFTTTNSEIICAFGYTKTIEFTAAADWTATVKESGNATVSKTSGSAGASTLDLTFNPNTDNTARKTISLVISAPGYSNAELKFTQERKADYEVVFRKYPDVYGKISTYYNFSGNFVEKLVNNTFGTFTLKQVNSNVSSEQIQLVFGDGGTAGSFAFNEVGFLIGTSGSGKGGYVTFPAITGKKLVKVEAFMGNSSTNQGCKLSIKSADGATRLTDEISGSVNSLSLARCEIPSIQYELTNSYGSYVCIPVNTTTVNTAYRLNFSSRAQIRWFTFYYE